MPTSTGEELRLFLKCTVIGRGVFGRCACWGGGGDTSRTFNKGLPKMVRRFYK